MNSWNFNELTQQDILDFKACMKDNGVVYGIPDKSTCQSGREISPRDMEKIKAKAAKGDKESQVLLKNIKAQSKSANDKENAKVAEAKKKKDLEAACKSGAKKGKECGGIKKEKGGKGGKGKKGGGKGKGGAAKGKGGAAKGKGGAAKGGSAKGGGSAQMQANAKKAQQQAQQSRNKRAAEVRTRIAELQKSLRQIKDPNVRKALEEQISLALKSVSALQQGQSVGTGSPGDVAKAPQAPAAPQAPKEGQTA